MGYQIAIYLIHVLYFIQCIIYRWKWGYTKYWYTPM